MAFVAKTENLVTASVSGVNTFTLSVAAQAGSCLVVMLRLSATGRTVTVTNNAGTPQAFTRYIDQDNTFELNVFVLENTSVCTAVDVSVSGGATTRYGLVYELSNVLTASAVDTGATKSSSGNSSVLSAGASGTLAQADEVLILCAWTSTSKVFVPDANWYNKALSGATGTDDRLCAVLKEVNLDASQSPQFAITGGSTPWAAGLLCLKLASPRTVPAGLPVNVLVDPEGSTDGTVIDDAIATADTIGSWLHPVSGVSINPTPLTIWTVEEESLGDMPRIVQVDGLDRGIGSSRLWRRTHTANSEAISFVFSGSGSTKTSLACKVRINSTGNYAAYDHIVINGLSPVAAVLQSERDLGGQLYLRAHAVNESSTPFVGANIAISDNVIYWVTLRYDSVNNSAFVRVYSSDGATLIGQSFCAMSAAASLSTQVNLGGTNHSENTATVSDFGPLIIDWTNGVFPLGVPISPPPLRPSRMPDALLVR